MVKEVPNLPSYDRSTMWLSLPELLNWNPQRDVAKPYPPAPRQATDRRRGMIETLLLYLFAGTALAAAALMIVLRHPMRVALALIACMLSLAGVYALLDVHVIAVFQVLIYVGAVMVFMVYAIMLLDVRDRSYTRRFSRLLVPGVAGAPPAARDPRPWRLALACRARRAGGAASFSGSRTSPSRSSTNTGCISSSSRCCWSRRVVAALAVLQVGRREPWITCKC